MTQLRPRCLFTKATSAIASCKQIIRDHGVEACIHFAAFAYVGESVNEPALYYENNVEQGIRLLGALSRIGRAPDRFLFDLRYLRRTPDIPIDEEHPQLPANPYGWSKLFVERIMSDYDRSSQLRFVALRYFNAAGATPERGERHEPETHLVPLVLKAAHGDIEHVTVFGNDYPTKDGTCVRDYIHVIDLAEAHALSLDYLRAGNPSTAINLGNGQGYSVLEVIEAARIVTGKEIPIRDAGPARRRSIASCSKRCKGSCRSRLAAAASGSRGNHQFRMGMAYETAGEAS